MSDYGSVTHEGLIINLTQEAFIHRDGIYRANGEDDAGNVYQIEWATTRQWDDEMEAAREARSRGDFSGSAVLDDESHACDWERPLIVDLIESAGG